MTIVPVEYSSGPQPSGSHFERMALSSPRLIQQLKFIVETDKLKGILRQTPLADSLRYENSAEHSWHLGLMAVLLAEHSDTPDIDVGRVVKMVLIHDIVEIDAGDTFSYDAQANLDKEERELLAAARLYGILPDDQAAELYALWREFEEMATPESRLANAVDRLHPLLLNIYNEGGSWQRHNITKDRVLKRMAPIAASSSALWLVVEQLLDDSVARGILAPAP